MWVRAEAASLAIAETSDIFIPLRIDTVLNGIARGLDDATEAATLEADMGAEIDTVVRPLSFTALDSLLPQRVTVFVTPPAGLAWTVMPDAANALAGPLSGLNWVFAAPAGPGTALNRAVADAIGAASETPDLIVIAHWGFVFAADTVEALSELMRDAAHRLRRPVRPVPQPDMAAIAGLLGGNAEWRLPHQIEIHALGRDETSLAICRRGLLTAGQALSLGTGVPVLEDDEPIWKASLRHEKAHRENPGYLIAPGRGVIVADDLTPQTEALMAGFARMTLCIDGPETAQPFSEEIAKAFVDWQRNRLQDSDQAQASRRPHWNSEV
jgi:rhamnose utilization protein RhaD (predicted bifunctional aldolase and dehydrogenase)